MKSVKTSAMESSMNADEPLSPNWHLCHLVIAATYTTEPLEQPLPQHPPLDWGRRATYSIRVCDIAGGHLSMLQEPNVQIMDERL
jgi:hypothetical protein